jgi:hypothetical protein
MMGVHFGAGWIALVMLIGGSWGGDLFTLALCVGFCCALGFALSLVAARKDGRRPWRYGLAYVALPFGILIFGGYSSSTAADAASIRLHWLGALLLIYATCVAGGIAGRWLSKPGQSA